MMLGELFRSDEGFQELALSSIRKFKPINGVFMTWLLSIGTMIIGGLLSLSKALASIRYLYTETPEQVEKVKSDNQTTVKVDQINAHEDITKTRLSDRLEKWKARLEAKKNRRG